MALAHAIVGREAELAELREVARLAADRRTPCSSRATRASARRRCSRPSSAAPRSRVLRARPTAAEAASSYAALHDLLQPVIGRARRAARAAAARARGGVAARGRGRPGRPAAGRARLPVAARRASREPCCSPSMTGSGSTPPRSAVLTFVLRRLEPGGAKVIATVRSGEADDAARRAGPQPPRRVTRSSSGVDAARPPRAAPARPRAGPASGWRRRALARLHDDVRGQPADGARADPRARGERRDGRAAAARPPDRRAAAGLARAAPRLVAALAEPTVDAVGERRARGGARRRRARPRRPPAALHASADRGGGRGAHAAAEWRVDPRAARRVGDDAGAARAPPRRRRRRARRGGGRGAGGRGGGGGGARRARSRPPSWRSARPR